MKKSAPSTCSQESAGSASDLNEPDLFGQSLSVSEMPTPSESSKSTGPKSPSLKMSEPSTQMDLEGSTSSVAGSLASRSPLPGSREAQKMTEISGQRWFPLLKSYGLNGSLAKTCEALLTSQWGSSAAFLTWRGSGTAPSHLLFQLAPSMPRTEGTECGLLPTPRSCSAMAAENIQNRAADKFPNLESVVARSLWPTPTTPTSGGERSGDRAGTGNLHYMARSGQLWATPQARDHMPAHKPEYIAEKKAQGHGMRNLNDEVKMWPTPSAQEPGWKNIEVVDKNGNPPTHHNQRFYDKKTGRIVQKGLQQVIEMWPPSGEQLPNVVGGSLNPTWVEWLMGFPTGWTDLNALETPSSRKSLSKSDGQSSQDGSDDLS